MSWALSVRNSDSQDLRGLNPLETSAPPAFQAAALVTVAAIARVVVRLGPVSSETGAIASVAVGVTATTGAVKATPEVASGHMEQQGNGV